MAFVLYLGSWLAVTISNYPGQLLALWARHRPDDLQARQSRQVLDFRL